MSKAFQTRLWTSLSLLSLNPVSLIKEALGYWCGTSIQQAKSQIASYASLLVVLAMDVTNHPMQPKLHY
jgi:hypothetical protein